MDWQQIISLFIVAVAFVLLVRYEIQKRKRMKLRACGGDCCSSVKILEEKLGEKIS